MIQKASVFANSSKLEGDYLEFGVGASFLMALELMEGKRHCWGFDSFEGLPKPTGTDDTGKFSKGEYAIGLGDFLASLPNRFSGCWTIVKGFYVKTLKEEQGVRKVAIIHIDCDLYESAKLVLDFVKPFLQTGTILLFDDYYCFKGDPEKGEALALQEFLDDNPMITVTQWLKYHFAGNSFIVKVRGEL